MTTSKQIANNVIWRYLDMFSAMGIQLLCTFIMARFLTPKDYGTLAIILAFTSLADVIINSGFGQALIREKEVTRLDYSTILYFNIGMSIIIYIVLYLSCGFISDFYENPELTDICKVGFLVLPLNALSIVQVNKLQRDIKFKKIFLLSFISSLCSAIIAIILAYLYHSVWALVIQIVASRFIKCFLLWITTDFIPVLKFSVNSFKKYFTFSKHILLSGLIGALFNEIYSLTIGKAYSATELGYYSQANKINNLASQTTTSVVQSVTYPILSKIRNNGGDIKDGYKKIIGITLVIVGFVMATIMSCAQDFFEICMGNPIWRVSGTYFLLLGISGILYPLQAINVNILFVTGNSKSNLKLEIIRRTLMALILLIAINYDITIFVFSLSIYAIIQLFLNLHYCGKPINYTVKQQLKDTMPIFTRLAIMIIVARSLTMLLPQEYIFTRMVLSILICGITGVVIFWKQKDFQTLRTLIKSYIKK